MDKGYSHSFPKIAVLRVNFVNGLSMGPIILVSSRTKSLTGNMMTISTDMIPQVAESSSDGRNDQGPISAFRRFASCGCSEEQQLAHDFSLSGQCTGSCIEKHRRNNQRIGRGASGATGLIVSH